MDIIVSFAVPRFVYDGGAGTSTSLCVESLTPERARSYAQEVRRLYPDSDLVRISLVETEFLDAPDGTLPKYWRRTTVEEF